MSSNEDDNILQKAAKWLQSGQNDPLKRILLPTQQQAMIHRAITTAVQRPTGPKTKVFPHLTITPRFALINGVLDCPVDQFVVLDLYHSRETHLRFEDCCSSDGDCPPFDNNTICMSLIELIDSEHRCLIILALLRDRNHYACLAELDLQNAKLVIYQSKLLAVEKPLPFAMLSIDDQAKSVFLLLSYHDSDGLFAAKEILISTNDGIPTMIIRDGPDHFTWRLYCAQSINRKVYGFAKGSNALPNFEELIVAENETFPPYTFVHREKLKLRAFPLSGYEGDLNTHCWYKTCLHALFRYKTKCVVLCVDLETLTWRSILNFECSFSIRRNPFNVDQNELVLIFKEEHRNLSNEMLVYNALIFPLGRPFLLTKLSLFAVRHFSYKNSSYGSILEAIALPPSLKPLSNSTCPYEGFQRFCIT